MGVHESQNMTKRSNQGITNVKKEKKNIPADAEFLMKELFGWTMTDRNNSKSPKWK